MPAPNPSIEKTLPAYGLQAPLMSNVRRRMQIPSHFFSDHSWPTPEELVEFAEKRHGFVRDEGNGGLWYSEDQDEWDRSQPNPIPDGMLRISWMGKYTHEEDVEKFISEQQYLAALELHLRTIGSTQAAARLATLLAPN